jgi:PEGA domain
MSFILRRERRILTIRKIAVYLGLTFVVSVPWAAARAPESRNQVMGEVHLQGVSKVEKTSGVWVDGQYVGYLKELKGNKRILLLPGEHTISVRQNGYQDFNDTILVKPGQKQTVKVAMVKGPTGLAPAQWAEIKIAVAPNRAAVFLDGRFVGHVGEFDGLGKALLVAPGSHDIKIALPGYQTFETNINPAARQKMELRTNLLKANVPIDPTLKGDPNQ